MLEILESYLALLWSQFQYDIDIMSQPWMYFCLMIPATCYFAFIILKWFVLMIPISYVVSAPFKLIGKGISIVKANKKK